MQSSILLKMRYLSDIELSFMEKKGGNYVWHILLDMYAFIG